MINKSIFKSYDIRGIYPLEFNDEAAFNIGRAFSRFSGAKRVVIGYDARISSPAIFKAFSQGIYSKDIYISNIGQVPSECLYFALGNYDFDAGIMITASHNPKEYNGFKMLKKIDNVINMVRGVDLLAAVKSDEIINKNEIEVEKMDIWNDFINHIFSFIDLSEITTFKIIIDASNGVAGNVISRIEDKLPLEIIHLNFNPDGNFPNHSPNPLEPGSADKLGETIIKEKADFGFIFDGDADRVFLVDESGKLVPADATLLLLAKYFLAKNPGMAIAYNAICSKAVPEFVKKWGGLPVRTKVGFVNVREGLLKAPKGHPGIMGGELSGHYCFKENFYMDSGMIAFLTLLVIFSKDQRKVSEIVDELSIYSKTDRNFEVKDKVTVIEKIKQKYSDGKQDFLDGITVEYTDWWFNLRPSNTEPVLRLTIEAYTKEILDKKLKELTKFVSK